MPYIGKIKVLLVDDEPDVREFLGYNLKKKGFEVYCCSNGKQAVKMAKQVIPHVVIMDVVMPVMDGIQACKQIRSEEKLKHIIIAFFSGRNESYADLEGFSAGADDYIYKPAGPAVVVERVNALIEKYFDKRFSGLAA